TRTHARGRLPGDSGPAGRTGTGGAMTDLNAILAISFRDLMKLLRDPARIVSTFISPLLLIGILGGTLQANLGKSVGFNYMTFIFTGILAQTLFSSVAQGWFPLSKAARTTSGRGYLVRP